MAVPTSITQLSTTEASNSPSGSEAIGTNLDNYLRAIQSILKTTVSQGTDITAASTITPGDGNYFVVTGSTTITAIGSTNSWNGREIVLKFSSTPQLTHSASLILPGAANITAAAGDVASFVQESSGVWRCCNYMKASGGTLVSYLTAASPTITSGSLTFADTTQMGTASSLGGFKNKAYNGRFSLWQRGTSFASTGVAIYTADRWYQYSVVGATASRVSASSPTSQYGLKVARDSGQTFTNTITVAQPYETVDIVPLRGQYLTLQVKAKAGANFSAASGTLNVYLYTGTGTEGKRVGGSFTGSVALISTGQVITTTQTTYTFTTSAVVPSNATQMELAFQFTPVGTAGADDSFTIEEVQLEAGSVATPFSLAGGSIAGEIAACQRYYFRLTASATTEYMTQTGYAVGTTTAWGMNKFPVTMRIKPTALEQSGTAGDYIAVRYGAVTNTTCSSVPAFVNASIDHAITSFTVASGLTNGTAGSVTSANSSAYLGWSAEL